MTTSTDRTAGLYRLLAWSSPGFPIGAFSYSHGLEAAAERGSIRDRATLQQWIAAIVVRGSGRIDADILRDGHRAVRAGDGDALAEANRRGLAYRGTAELALESAQQGAAFLAAWKNAWVASAPNPTPLSASGEREFAGGAETPRPVYGDRLSEAQPRTGEGLLPDEPTCHPAAFGAAAAQAGIALEDALLAYLHAFAGNLVSAGIRLGIIGQTDGQRTLAALEAEITMAAREAIGRGPEDFGSTTFAADLASMAHETQYTRLFRS